MADYTESRRILPWLHRANEDAGDPDGTQLPPGSMPIPEPDALGERLVLQMRLDALNDELAEIDDRRAAIKGQIEKAKADRLTTGEWADADWYRRAQGALRHLGVERNDTAREIGETNRRLRAVNNALNRNTFQLAVREVVDDLTWQRIVHRHDQLKGDA